MLIHTPSISDILVIQKDERAYYWSACCENLLRKHGIIPWLFEKAASAAVVNVYTRGSVKVDVGGTALIEGPLPDAALEKLGISARVHSMVSLDLYVSPERKLSPFEYPKAALFAKDPATGVRSEPYQYVPEDVRYHKEKFFFQTFHSDDRWKPVLFASLDGTEEQAVVAVTDGRRLVLGIPMIDLSCAMMAWSALPDGYYRTISQLPSTSLESWLVEALRKLAVSNGHPWVRISSWPQGRNWACSVRADYDRSITDAQLRRLLVLYESQALRATWCFLEWNCPTHQVHLLKRAGHEIALHTGARTLRDFEAEVASIQLETNLSLRGVTSHGGQGIRTRTS